MPDDKKPEVIAAVGGFAKPDKFDGQGSVERFLDHFHVVSKANGWTLEAQKLHLPTALSGPAFDFFRRLSTAEKASVDTLKGTSRVDTSVAMEDSADEALREKEEYYRKLNESLRSKAASLIAQAENALKEQTEACGTFDIHLLGRGRHTETGMAATEQSNANLTNTQHEPYQVTLQPKLDAHVPDHGSDSDDSLTEAFGSLEATGEPSSQSASSIASRKLGSAAQARLYQAKLRVANAEISRLKAQHDKVLKENNLLNDRVKSSEKENQKAIVGAQKYATESSKLKEALNEANSITQKLKSECISWKKDAENNRKEAQAASKSNAQTEVKLKRVNEEVEKLKHALETEKRRAKEAADATRERIASLEASHKQLERQRQELIAGFKKQMKLVDVLKRQKLHLEGAKLLHISEEEFLKVVDLSLDE